ncbi:calcium-activated chloride channel-domain-containing protein [Crassisporium funariophilum]|nr:calcium-activated chloride channel-domain-containing protein [Crassisporium funariophilum]
MPDTRRPDVDLVITFRATKKTSLSKQQTREDARKAEQQYKRLIETLTYAGLKAVGRRGESLGHLLVFVTCPPKHVEELVRRERHSDFLSGLPVTPVPNVQPLSPADRLRLVYSYISSTPKDGGLGISPDAPEWDLVESIFPLHDREFNEHWVRAWKPRNIASVQLERIREQFGDSLALYFAFLSSYTRSLVVPASLGLAAHFLLPPYAPVYSILLCVWSIGFVEWWRIHERILSLRFGTRGSFRVEKQRAQYKQGMQWWARELRVIASVPVIIIFAGILSAILTGIFVFEAFVAQLYQGPGKQVITFLPTLLFVILVPRFLAIYQAIAVKLTIWENHAHKSTYTASLTLKTFALSALVAYMGLSLSAFVYVPFGEGVMRSVQAYLFNGTVATQGFGATLRDMLNGTLVTMNTDSGMLPDAFSASGKSKVGIWDMDSINVTTKLNPGRLRDQMFAYTVTNQAVNTFLEVGLPFVLRRFRKGKSPAKTAHVSGGSVNGDGLKKRVVFEDEKERGGMEERAFLDSVREEAALPEYDLFVDYSEMVVQFGYVVLWSTIWPLAGAMALLNNLLELRSDAFKITVHNRRPVPSRTDTIGAWLDALTFLTWLGALTNSALIYLFSPALLPVTPSSYLTSHNITEPLAEHLSGAAGALPSVGRGIDGTATPSSLSATKELLLKAILVSLVASHGFMLLRAVIRHLVERVFWRGSGEVEEREREDKVVKEKFLSGAGVDLTGSKLRVGAGDGGVEGEGEQDSMGFWEHDEGLEEIQRISKEA